MMGAAALKLRGTELQQSILQTGLDVLGRHGPVYQDQALEADWHGDFIGPDVSAGLIYEHLYRRAATIYSGSNEVQRNIIAKGALGL
jgi:alkylation response protein AidB-like acyl-CoA dehydrogenase